MKKFCIATALIILVTACVTTTTDDTLKPFLPVFGKPLKVAQLPKQRLESAKVELGRTLYHEKRLSRDNSISCNSCHDTMGFGVDGKKFSLGFEGHLTGRNSPTSFNAFMHVTQFWDGRAATVEEQAKGPILAGKEMGMPSSKAVVAKLKGIPEYPPLFKKAFPRDKDAVNYMNVGTAIGAFERNLVTPGRFDDFLAGKKSALTKREQKGLKTFVTTGCVSCHTGPLVGGYSYQKLGLVKPWPNQADVGRSSIVGDEALKMFFKVPSLRNIEKTGPYFHDSSSKTLEDAVTKMAKHQLGRELSGEQLGDIVAFLKSLTGKIPAQYIKKRPF